jgi:hypothetical protein
VTNVVMIPPDGLLEVWHSERPINARSWLEGHGTGKYVALNVIVGEDQPGRVEYLIADEGVLNERARNVLARLTGVHVVLLGNVVLTGLHPDTIMEVIDGSG